MSLAVVYSRAQSGIQAPPVTVEVHLANGLPSLSIVGLPAVAVKESKDRVRGAIINSNFEFPTRRITVNLAPADLPKDGGRFDLPIALGILAAAGQIPKDALPGHEFVAELALSGNLRPVRGTLTAALGIADTGRALVVASGNCDEAALVSGVCVHGADHLLDVTAHLIDRPALACAQVRNAAQTGAVVPDLRDVRGQSHARRALEVAAAGGHSLLMIGPPGTGKTMLASRLPGILPPLLGTEALESAAIYSVADGHFNAGRWRARPFRAPHHTASAAALVGGGGHPRPGEISLAHHGVLFLDELPEFSRHVLEVLREPLESGRIVISRAARQCEFPARFQLIAAMNPCPCGYLGDASGRCSCTCEQVQRYRQRISGPLLDRIDIQIEVPPVPRTLLRDPQPGEASKLVRQRVIAARDRQFQGRACLNAALTGAALEQACKLSDASHAVLDRAMDALGLSARGYHRILRVARTIADLAGAQHIAGDHLREAISYRILDRRPR